MASQRGFSLLEILVALAIAAMALGLLYRVSGNNARQAGGLIQHERAMVLAQSLLAAHQTVPPWGLNETGAAGEHAWHVGSQTYPTTATDADPGVTPLHEVQVQVSWPDGQAMRHFNLTSLRPERRLLPGEEELAE